MSTNLPAAYTYVGLPIASGGAHRLGAMELGVAVAKVREFLDMCTVPDGPAVEFIEQVDVPELRVPGALRRHLKQRFGSTARAAASAEEAIAFFEAVGTQPTNQWGLAPIRFVSHTRFRILDPATGSAIASQSPEHFGGIEYQWQVPLGVSQTRLILDNGARLGIELCIPRSDADVLQRVVPWLQDRLPMKLSPPHWRAWYPTSTGSYVARKLAAAPGG